MNPSITEIVSHLMTALGSIGLGGLGVAYMNRKPRRVTDAEARKIGAEADEALAATRLHATEEWDKLFVGLRSEIDRQDRELERLAEKFVAARKEVHQIRNLATALESFGRAYMRHVDNLEDVIRKLGGTPPARPAMVLPELQSIA